MTVRREAEHDVYRREDLYRLVLENVRDIVALVSADGRLLYASPSHLEVLGWMPDRVVGRAAADVVHPDDRADAVAAIARAAASGAPERREVRVRRRDGGWASLEVVLSAVGGEDDRMLLATARDVGAERQAASAARASRDLLEALLGAVSDAVTVVEPDGAVSYANARALELIGYETLEELLAVPPGELVASFVLHGEDGEPLPVERLPTRRVLLGEPAAEELVGYRVLATGEERWSVVRALPIRDENGVLARVIGIFHDVTEQRRGAHRRRLLAEASPHLRASLDYERGVRTLGPLVVPALADWYAVDLLEQGELRRVAVAHADPDKTAMGWQLSRHAGAGALVRRAVDQGEPVLVPELADELLAAGDEEALRLARELGLRSTVSLPLVSRGRTLGALTLTIAESEHGFGAEDLRIAEELARRIASAVDNARLYREMREAAALLDLLFGSAPVGFAFLDAELRFVRVNEALADINGLPAADHLGRSLLDVVPGVGDEVFRAYDRAVTHGEATLDLETAGETPRLPGERRSFRVSVYPVRDAAGEILGAGAIVADETERVALLAREQQARADAEAAAASLRILEQISQAALEHLSLDDLLDELLARLVDLVRADTAAILLRDAAGERIEVRATAGLGPVSAAAAVPVGEGLAGRVAQSRRAEVVEDLAEVELAAPHLREHGVRSLAAVPLLAEGEAVGVLHVGSVERRRFGPEDVRLLELVAERIALAFVQAELYEAERAARTAAQEAQERLAFLAEASGVLGESLDYAATLSTLARIVVPRLADWCAIDVLRPDDVVERVAVAHVDPRKVALAEDLHRRFPPRPDDEGGVHGVLRSGEPVLFPEIPDALLEERLADRPEYLAALRELGLRSVMMVPLLSRGRTLGVMLLIWAESGRRYDEDDLAFAQELARRAAVAVDNALLFREAEERGRAARILQSVGDGVFLLDGAGVVRYWNRAAEAITGIAAVDVRDRPAAAAIPGWTTIERLVPVGDPPQSVPLQVGGRELWLSLSGVALEEGTVYAFRDLTEERALEELRTEFVSTVSHELRTPLAAIYGAAMTLRRADVELAATQREGLLEVVTGEADRLARIVNDILWASRLDSGALHVSIERCEPAALAASVVGAQRAHLPAGIELELVLPEAAPAVAADPDKVRQVLVNLLDNAVKYSPDGGRVEVRLTTRGSHARFAVADEGLGIPFGEQRRIFDKFYRLDPNLTRGVGGTGLGLYICRELVRRMSGRIWVESEPGRGSTFFVELPVADGARSRL